MLKGSQVGPYQITDIQGWLKAGYVSYDDPAWFEGCNGWVKVKDIPNIESSHEGHSLSGHLLPPFEAYVGTQPYIFISYAHKDSEQVFQEISKLNDAGYKIWYDEGIEASTEWPEEIANAVLGCSAFLVFVSPRSTASVNCRNEINLALNEDKPFLAVHLEDSALPPGLRLRMGDLQAILKYKIPEDMYVKKLRQTLDQLLGKKKRKSDTLKTNLATSGAPTRATNSSPAERPWKRKLTLAIMLVLVIGCLGMGYFFFAEDNESNAESEMKFFTVGQPWKVPSINAEMIWCKPGRFQMGSPDSEVGRKEDEILREISLTEGFFLGKYEVTQRQWSTLMDSTPSKFVGQDRPVEQVNWYHAAEFCKKLTERERAAGRLPLDWFYTLPTEAEWEYACRAGTSTKLPWGNKIHANHANYNQTGTEETVKVGSYPGNAWGFHDMIGNVAEWCHDWYGPYNLSLKVNPTGPVTGSYRVVRGNAWVDKSDMVRTSRRVYKKGNLINSTQGFRLCLKQAVSKDNAKYADKGGISGYALEGWWKFDDAQGNTAKDSSGMGRHGLLHNFDSAAWVRGPVGGALRFDGINDFVKVTEYKGVSEAHSRSITFWLQTDHVDSTLISWGSKKASEKWLLRVSNPLQNSGLIHLDIEESYALTDQLLDGNWNHLSVVLPKSQNSVKSVKFFINGNPIGTNFIQAKKSISTVLSQDTAIGKDSFSDYSNFRGAMDDLRIYKRDLSASEVRELYLSGSPSEAGWVEKISYPNNLGINENLVGWWPMDETSGTKVSDASGSYKDGTLKGFAANDNPWVKGKVGNALRFDGVDNYVDLGPFRFGGESTFSSWVKFESWSRSTCLLDLGNGEAKQNILVGNQKGGGNLFYSRYYDRQSQTLIYPSFWSLNDWDHVCVMSLKSGHSVLFKNGQLVKSIGYTFVAETFRRSQYLGKSSFGNLEKFKGVLDDVRIYDRALSPYEVGLLHQWDGVQEKKQEPVISVKPNIRDGLVAWWEFEDKTGRTARDSSGRGRNGSLEGYESKHKSWGPGPVGNALYFDGQNDFVDLVGFTWGGEASVSLWAKFQSAKPWARIFEFGDGRKSDNLSLSSAGNFSSLRFENWKGESQQVITLPSSLSINKWFHVVCSMVSSGEVKIYQNGQLIKTQSLQFAAPQFRRKKFIGKSFWSDSSYFHGALDDFRLYERALVQAEVKELYALGDLMLLDDRHSAWLEEAARSKAKIEKDSEPKSKYSDELLKAVKNWKKIPRSVFPMGGVCVIREMNVKMFGDEVMKKRNKALSTRELLSYANKGLNITNVDETRLTVSTLLKPEKPIIITGVNGEQLEFTRTFGSRMKGFIQMDQTDFKDRVAKLFELRKENR